MSGVPGLVSPESEIGDGGGGGVGGCSVSEIHGQLLIVHECLSERGLYYKIISDGPVEIIAPEVRVTGRLVVHGDLEITGNILVREGEAGGGNVLAEHEVRAKDGVFMDPLLQF